jgi:iron complex transport system substrate-binding protein
MLLTDLPDGDWAAETNLPAVRNGQVYAADGDYFSCPGPRLVDGVELLAHLLHSDQFPAPALPDAFVRCII